MSDLTAVDPAFGVDEFDQMKIYPSDETIVRNLLLILFGKPGFYPSIPSLGMNIQQYLYSFEDNMDTTLIKAKLAYQCKDFLPLIQDGSMDIYTTRSKGNPVLVFALPVIHDNTYATLVLGVTILNSGEMQFNFIFNDDNNQEI